MSTGKTNRLLSRNIGLEKRIKPPVCVTRQPPEIWTFHPYLTPLQRSHQASHMGNWGTVTLPETSTSFRKLFCTGKTIAVKTKGAHGPCWQEHWREEKPLGSSVTFSQTLLGRTQVVIREMLFPPCAGLCWDAGGRPRSCVCLHHSLPDPGERWRYSRDESGSSLPAQQQCQRKLLPMVSSPNSSQGT